VRLRRRQVRSHRQRKGRSLQKRVQAGSYPSWKERKSSGKELGASQAHCGTGLKASTKSQKGPGPTRARKTTRTSGEGVPARGGKDVKPHLHSLLDGGDIWAPPKIREKRSFETPTGTESHWWGPEKCGHERGADEEKAGALQKNGGK